MGIHGKLALLVPGLVAVTLAGQGLLAAEEQRCEQVEALRHRELWRLQAAATPAARWEPTEPSGALGRALVELEASSEELEGLALVDGRGHVVARAGAGALEEEAHSGIGRRVRAGGPPVWERRDGGIWMALPLEPSAGLRALIAYVSLAKLEEEARKSRVRWLVLAGGLAALGGVALQRLLERGVLQPLRTLQAAARQMGGGALKVRVPPLEGPEMQELARALNSMAEALMAQRELVERAVASRTRALVEANQQLAQLASTDGLTGVSNHRRFQEALTHEVLRSERSGQPLSVLMLDVDHFKRFNDTHGHMAGDALLRALAATLQGALRETDLLSRYGGEEFAVLLPETDKPGALQVGERLRSAVDAQLCGPEQRSVSISVGVATLGCDGRTPEALLAAADRALYAAKHHGRNRVEAA